MKNAILLLLLTIPFLTIGQNSKAKVEYDKDSNQVTVDGVKSFKIDKIGCGFNPDCHYDVFDNEGNKLMVINMRSFNSPVEVSKSNPQGRVTYSEFVFLDSKQKAEVSFYAIKTEKVAKKIIAYNLIVNGKLDQKSVDDFVLSNGTPYAERVKF